MYSHGCVLSLTVQDLIDCGVVRLCDVDHAIHLLLGARASGTIEIDVAPAAFEEFRRKFKANAVADLASRHEKRVQA